MPGTVIAASLARWRARVAFPLLVVGFGVVLGLVAIYAATARSSAGVLVLVAVLVPILVLAVPRSERILLAALIVDVPLGWDFNLDYRTAIAKLGSIGGVEISLTTLALAGLYGAWLVQSLTGRSAEDRLQLRSAAPLAALLCFTILSVSVAQDRTLSAYEILLIVQTVLLFVYIASRLRGERAVAFVATAMAAGLLLESLIMLGQRYAHLQFDLAGLSTTSAPRPDDLTHEASRIGGTLGSPNAAGAYLALTIVPVIAMLALPIQRWRKALAAAAAAFGLLALILTFSRGGWLSLVVSVVVLLALAARGGRIRPAVRVALAVVLAAVVVGFRGPISERLNGNDRGSAASRVPLMKLAGEMIRSQPLLGIGANNFATRIPDFAGPEFSRDWIYTVHNKYLLLWAEAGIGALAAFLWFLGATIRRGVSTTGEDEPLLAPLAAALTAAFVGQIADMLVEPYHSRPEVQGLVFVAALIAAMHLMARDRRTRPQLPVVPEGRRSAPRLLDDLHPGPVVGRSPGR